MKAFILDQYPNSDIEIMCLTCVKNYYSTCNVIFALVSKTIFTQKTTMLEHLSVLNICATTYVVTYSYKDSMYAVPNPNVDPDRYFYICYNPTLSHYDIIQGINDNQCNHNIYNYIEERHGKDAQILYLINMVEPADLTKISCELNLKGIYYVLKIYWMTINFESHIQKLNTKIQQLANVDQAIVNQKEAELINKFIEQVKIFSDFKPIVCL